MPAIFFMNMQKKIITLREEAEHAVFAYQRKMKGKLLVGGSTIPSGYILPKLLGMFHKRYPDVITSLKAGDTSQVIEMVIKADVEIGMVGARINHPSVSYEPFQGDRLVLVMNPDNPLASKGNLTLHDLCLAPFILREYGSGSRMAFQNFLNSVSMSLQNLNVVAEMGTTQAVKEALKIGLGVSIISNRAIEDEINCGMLKIVPVDGLDITRNFYLAFHRSRTMSPVCIAFRNFCRTLIDNSVPIQEGDTP